MFEQIETDVELQLRKVGIRIDKSADEYLYVRATVMEVGEMGFVYHLEVSVKQKVTLARDPSILTEGITWDQGYLATVPKGGARNVIREDIRDLVDKFLNDYLAVNPITR